ncbi:hypothetical protein K432DRAFT_277318, partial [Lepidopterella palustris CBS 459.81]
LLLLDRHGSHVDVYFVWALKQHNIWLVWLPPHTSYILHPHDISGFSPIKSRYSGQITELAMLGDAATVKKQRFIIAYNMACMKSLAERVICGGWKEAGLVPWNPSKALTSSQVVGQPGTPPPQP